MKDDNIKDTKYIYTVYIKYIYTVYIYCIYNVYIYNILYVIYPEKYLLRDNS